MKVKRQKHVRRILNFYRNNFGHAAPFNVLVDGTFCKAALVSKVNISEQIPKYLDAEVKLFTTKCTLAECEAFGEFLFIISSFHFYYVVVTNLRPPLNKKLFHVYRPSGLKRADWNFLFIIFGKRVFFPHFFCIS